MKLIANSVTKMNMWLPFLLLSNTVYEIRENLFSRVKSEIQIRAFFSAKPEKSRIREIKLPLQVQKCLYAYDNKNLFRLLHGCLVWSMVLRFFLKLNSNKIVPKYKIYGNGLPLTLVISHQTFRLVTKYTHIYSGRFRVSLPYFITLGMGYQMRQKNRWSVYFSKISTSPSFQSSMKYRTSIKGIKWCCVISLYISLPSIANSQSQKIATLLRKN